MINKKIRFSIIIILFCAFFCLNGHRAAASYFHEVYETNKVYYVWNLDGGNGGDMPTEGNDFDRNIRYMENPHKENYIFVGWAEASDPTNISYVTWDESFGSYYMFMYGVYPNVGDTIVYTAVWEKEKAGETEIVSVKPSGNNLVVNWNAVTSEKASGYMLYRAEKENGTYELIATINDAECTSFTDNVEAGVTYYYKIGVYHINYDSNDLSVAVSGIVPLSSGKKLSKVSNVTTYNSVEMGRYRKCLPDDSEWWMMDYKVTETSFYYYSAKADEIFNYSIDGKDYVAFLKDEKLYVYQIKQNGNIKKIKTISLKGLNYDLFMGMYHGIDDNFYLALGFTNIDEDDDATVIKVIKYNSKWKKIATAEIKGSASNVYKGIVVPENYCDFDMNGTTLYMYTARIMYTYTDGINHQTNIAFEIDTETMQAREMNLDYVSHSFAEYVRFKDENIYLLAQGDGYPRGLWLKILHEYESNKEYNRLDTMDTLEDFMGYSNLGYTDHIDKTSVMLCEYSHCDYMNYNYTGAHVCGMEVSATKVLTCGLSVPHDNTLNGLSGYDESYPKNVYLTITDRDGESSEYIWLTKFGLLDSDVFIYEPRLIKISDDYFVILYATKTSKGKQKVKYLLLNGEGKVIKQKTYQGLEYDALSQPVYSNGKIFWCTTSSGKLTVNRIPLVYK